MRMDSKRVKRAGLKRKGRGGEVREAYLHAEI